MSIAELRCALQSEKDVQLQSVLYKELKRRDGVISPNRVSKTPPGMELVSTAELDSLQRTVDKSKRQSLAAKLKLPTLASIAPQPPTTPRDPNMGAPPIEPPPKFPASADAPVPIQAVLDQMSVDELKLQLAGNLDPLRLALTYRELKKRQQLVNY